MAKIKLLIEGGDMKPGPALAQQLGPMGINMGKVIGDVNNATKEFKGMKVPVELDVDEKTKDFTIKALSPPTSELLKKEANIDKGTSKNLEIKTSNLSIEDIIKVSKIKKDGLLDRDLKKSVKSVLGTAETLGLLIENKRPIEISKEIDEGKYDKEIQDEKTETTEEKRQELKEYFKKIKSSQDEKIAKEQKEKEEAEQAKTDAAAKKPAEADKATKK